MNLVQIAAWLRQTSTIVGCATLASLAAAIVSGEMTWPAAVPVAIGALVAIAMPGHPEVSAAVSKVVTDSVDVANPTKRIEAITALGNDLPAAAAAVSSVATSVKSPEIKT